MVDMVKLSNKKINGIPLKNYLLVIFIFGLVIIGSLYICQWYKLYKTDKLATSYLVKTNTISNSINSYEEMNSVFSETANNYFVYVSYTNSSEIYRMEKDLRKIINSYQLQDNFYYIDMTELMKENGYLEKLNNTLGLTQYKITKLPTIVYFDEQMNQDNILKRADNRIFQAADFVHMLDIKGITEQ
ncbi:MAG TPA: hypothetical protein PK737_01020 [Bacilli bacterium]|nr:hypothetical protein [Bacilli bacterium]